MQSHTQGNKRSKRIHQNNQRSKDLTLEGVDELVPKYGSSHRSTLPEDDDGSPGKSPHVELIEEYLSEPIACFENESTRRGGVVLATSHYSE